MFDSIDIEISTQCNFKCPYCSNYKYGREQILMDEEVFDIILKQLAFSNFHGRVTPSLYNEPTLHPRFVEYMDRIKKALPECQLVVYTNGSKLGKGLHYRLLGVVDKWKVTKHPQFKRQFFVKKCPDDIELRKFDSSYILHNRCGTVDYPLAKGKPDRCFANLNAMYINYKGDVIVCCNDFNGEYSVGNVRYAKLYDLWGIALAKKILIRNGNFDNPACNKCNCVIGE